MQRSRILSTLGLVVTLALTGCLPRDREITSEVLAELTNTPSITEQDKLEFTVHGVSVGGSPRAGYSDLCLPIQSEVSPTPEESFPKIIGILVEENYYFTQPDSPFEECVYTRVTEDHLCKQAKLGNAVFKGWGGNASTPEPGVVHREIHFECQNLVGGNQSRIKVTMDTELELR